LIEVKALARRLTHCSGHERNPRDGSKDFPARPREHRNDYRCAGPYQGRSTGLYVATVAAYMGFIAVMALALMNPGLVIPMAIFALFVVAGFGVPTVWVRMNPANDSRALTFYQFRHRGIETLTGRLSAGQASVQVLILPVLILAWGLTCSVIIALT
jgi:Flp pilus assembly protein TadB